jgi:hypothetical protein
LVLISRSTPSPARSHRCACLLQQQLKEPLEEIEDCLAKPVAHGGRQRTSVEVMRQYEENPYPR